MGDVGALSLGGALGTIAVITKVGDDPFGDYVRWALAETFGPITFLICVLGGLGNSVFHPADYSIFNASVSPSRTDAAESRETSRSDERPPARTATLTGSSPCSSCHRRWSCPRD